LEQGTASPAFSVAIEMYCLCYADVMAAERGSKLAKGVLERLGRYRILRDARKELRQWSVECGLTGASAGKVSAAAPSKEESPLARLRAAKFERSQIRRVK